jgi:hypothetical protein
LADRRYFLGLFSALRQPQNVLTTGYGCDEPSVTFGIKKYRLSLEFLILKGWN